jgi:hypothetical protein
LCSSVSDVVEGTEKYVYGCQLIFMQGRELNLRRRVCVEIPKPSRVELKMLPPRVLT